MTVTAFSQRTRAAIADQAARSAAPPESFADWARRRKVFLWSMQLTAGASVEVNRRTVVRSGAGTEVEAEAKDTSIDGLVRFHAEQPLRCLYRGAKVADHARLPVKRNAENGA